MHSAVLCRSGDASVSRAGVRQTRLQGCISCVRPAPRRQGGVTRAIAAEETAEQKIRIKLKAYELPLLKQSVKEILQAASNTGIGRCLAQHKLGQNQVAHINRHRLSLPPALELWSCLVQRPTFLGQSPFQQGYASTQCSDHLM